MAKKEFTGVNLTLPECRLAFPVVFQKKLNDLKGKEEWAVTMLFDKKTDMTPLKQAMVKAAKQEFGPDVDLKTLDLKRIQDGDTKDRAEYKGMWVVKAATRLKAPGVVGPDVQPILDPNEIYSGVYARVNVTVKAYTLPQKGVTLYLNHVQKTKDGEAFAGGPQAKDVFEAIGVEEGEVAAGSSDLEF